VLGRLAGNVWEWVWDYYDAGYYGSRPDPDADPIGPEGGSKRVYRGGSFETGATTCRAANRQSGSPDSSKGKGLRTVRTALP